MRNILSFENLVALLKCVPLYPNQIWYIYAFRTVRFHTDSQLPAKEVFRTPCGQVLRQDQELDSKSAKHFNQAVKYIMKHNSKDFDVIVYVGNLYFKNSGLIKVPHKYAPKQFNFIIKFFDKSFNNDVVNDIRNWDVNLATYDVI